MDQNEEVNSINSDLIRGHIDTIILKALQAGDRYGYDIIKEIEQKSDGQYVIKQPTLYSCLKRLEVQGFVKSYWGSKSIGGRKKYFTLTDMGRELFIKNKSDWDYSRNIINKLISDEDYSTIEYSDVADSVQNAVIENDVAETEEAENLANIETTVTEEPIVNETEETEHYKQLSIDDLVDTENETIEEAELAESVEEFSEQPIEVTEGFEVSDEEISNESIEDDLEEQDDIIVGDHEDAEDFDEAALTVEDRETVTDSEETDNIIVGDEEVGDIIVADEEQVEEFDKEPFGDIKEDIEFLENEFNEIAFVDTDDTEQFSNEDSDELGDIIVGDSYQEDPLPLSVAEQSYANDEGIFEEDNSDLINKFYDEQSHESYLSNVGNAQYEPSEDDELDYNNYFTDIDEYDDEDEVASAVTIDESEELYYDDAIILPPDEPIEEPEQEEQQTCDAIILPPDEPIEEPVQEETQPACDAVILPPDEPIEPEQEETQPACDAVILPPDEPIEEPMQEEQQPACDAVILPPDEPIEEPEQEETQPACDAVILPPDEPQPIDTQAYETTVLQETHINKVQFDKYTREDPKENKTVFYSYKRSVPDVDHDSEIIDKEYRGVITKLISDNVVFDEPEPPLQVPDIDYASAEYFKTPPPPDVYEPKAQETQVPPQYFQQSEIITPPEQQSQEFSINNKTFTPEQSDNVDIRTHNDKTIRAYNNKHYYYSNQLRLLQCGILFGVMLLEIIICFYLIEVVHKNMNITPVNLIIYIGAVILAALFPIIAYVMARSDYYKRKRINYSGRSSALFSIASTVLLMLITFFLNVYAGILIGDITNYLSSLILPMVLSTNVIVNAVIFHILYTSGRYNIEE